MSPRQIPVTGWIVDPRLDETQDLVVVTEPELVQALEPDHAKQFVTLEGLEGAEVLEVVAAALAGDPEQACFRIAEARTALGAVRDHLRGEVS